MKLFVSILLDGLRLLALRAPRTALSVPATGLFVAVVAVYFAVMLGLAVLDTSAPRQFEADGVTTLLADSLLALVASWLLAALAHRRSIVWGVASILLAATVANEVVVHWPVEYLSTLLDQRGQAELATLLDLAGRAWWFVVLAAFARRLAPQPFGRVLAAAALAYAVTAAAWWWLPSSPLISHAGASTGATGLPLLGGDGDAGVDHAPSFDAEEVMFNQRALLDSALARLRPQTPDKTDLFVIAFAGDAQEGVFRNEVDYAEQLFSDRFDAKGHVLVLGNSAATVDSRPLATWTNLHYALEAIAKKMDPSEDILLMYLTTHGSEDHELLVDLDPLPLNQIAPEDLADALRTMPGIRWKVIVVNACYSGGFIDALRDDSTMVITSARADRTSFGCGSDSEITWFGKAFLVDALNQTTSLRKAFDIATKYVGQWEATEHEESSRPQIASSPSIEAKLADWQRQLPDRPAVPFVPTEAPAAALR